MPTKIQEQYRQYVENHYKNKRPGKPKSFEDWKRSANVLPEVTAKGNKPVGTNDTAKALRSYNESLYESYRSDDAVTGGRTITPYSPKQNTAKSSKQTERDAEISRGKSSTSSTGVEYNPDKTTSNNNTIGQTQQGSNNDSKPSRDVANKPNSNTNNATRSEDDKPVANQTKKSYDWNKSNDDYMNRNVDARMQFDSDGDGKLSNSEIAAMQRALIDAGYDLGKTGRNKDGVDGQIGKKTKTALMDFMSKQSGPKKADVTNVDYGQASLSPRGSRSTSRGEDSEAQGGIDYLGETNNDELMSYGFDVPEELPDEQSGDLLRDYTPRQLRDIRRRNFDNYADENFDSESDEDNEAYANGQAEINEQYDADRAERRARRREARRQRRAERRGSNSYANGGRMVTREMMQRKFGNPLISKNGDEYYLL